MTTVSQEAREAAADLKAGNRGAIAVHEAVLIDGMRKGLLDQSATVQAFAKFEQSIRQQAERGEAWRPIETAPKDGRGVLMIDMSAPTPEASTAHFYEGKWWLLAEGDRSREDGDWAYNCPWYATPTHWQPLPTPPEAV